MKIFDKFRSHSQNRIRHHLRLAVCGQVWARLDAVWAQARTRRLLVTIMALILTACDVREPTRFISTVDAELLTYCELASDRWYDATGIAVECLYGRSDNHLPLYWGDPHHACAAGRAHAGGIVVRKGWSPECKLEGSPLTDPTYPNNVEVGPDRVYLDIITHEIGHALAGVNKGHAESGLMAATAYPPDDIDQASVDWLCRHAECAWEEAE